MSSIGFWVEVRRLKFIISPKPFLLRVQTWFHALKWFRGLK